LNDERSAAHSEAPHTPDVVIVGAGPAGLTAAHRLCKHDVRPVVLEKAGIVGGHARTDEFEGYRFDIGGHRFFTKIEQVTEIWEEVLGDRFMRVPRLSRIYYDGSFFHYPLRLGNVIRGLGLWNSFLIVMSFFRSQLFPYPEEENFEQWVCNRFGRRLYETFFKTYTEKVWGIPCDEIRAEWAAQRIKGLSFRKAVTNAIIGDRKKSAKTLIKEFHYPELGPGMMWEEMARQVEARGGEVQMRHEAATIHHDGSRIVGITVRSPSGEERVEGTDYILSMPLTDVIACMDPAPPESVTRAADQLTYRDFLTTCVIVDHPDLFPDNWIYIHSPEVRMGRLQNFKNWSRHMVPDPSKTSLGAEFFVNVGDDLWCMDDEDLISLTARELEKLQLTRGAAVEKGVVYRQPKAYPVYDSTYTEHLDLVRDYIEDFENLQMIGRNGLHKYNNQDHSMLTAIMAVENLFGADHDIWQVNTDQDYHEGAVES